MRCKDSNNYIVDSKEMKKSPSFLKNKIGWRGGEEKGMLI